MKRAIGVILVAAIIFAFTQIVSAIYLVDQEAGTIIWYDDSEFDENGYWQPDAPTSVETYYNLVLVNNLEKRQTWLNSGDYLEVDDEDFRQLSNRIVAGITGDYKKLHSGYANHADKCIFCIKPFQMRFAVSDTDSQSPP